MAAKKTPAHQRRLAKCQERPPPNPVAGKCRQLISKDLYEFHPKFPNYKVSSKLNCEDYQVGLEVPASINKQAHF